MFSTPTPLAKPRVTKWLLVALTLAAFWRGVWALGGKSLWWDESLSLHRVEGTLAYALSGEIALTDSVVELSTVDNHPPAYFVVLWLAIRLFGQSEFALRVPSLFFLTPIVPLLYATGRRLVNRRAGLAAAMLGAISPMYLWYSQEARMYAMVAVLSLFSFYCFARAFLGRQRGLELQRRWPWIVGCILASTLTLLTHHLGSLLVAFEILALVVLILWESVSRRVLIPTAAVLATVSLVSLYRAVLNLPNIPSNRAGWSFVQLPVLLRDLLNSFSLGLSVDVADWYVMAVDLLCLLLMVIGAARLLVPSGRQKWHSTGWLLLSYLIIPVALLYLVSYVQPAYLTSRHLIMITPAFHLLVATGLTAWRGRSLVIASLAWVILLSGVGYSTYNYFYDPAYDKDQHREWGAYLNDHVRPGDVVVVDPPHIEELYHYYTDIDVPWIGLPSLGGTSEQTVAKLEEIVAQHDRVWLAFSSTPAWGDPDHPAGAWLNENAFLVDYQEFEGYGSAVLLFCYLPGRPSVPATPGDVEPVEIRFTPALRLTGYRTLTMAQPGKLLHVELIWAVDEPIPEEASMVLRLVDAEGHLWGQGDQCPFNGLYPMWQWPLGQQLVDERELLIWPGTPPGEYELELQLVRRPGGCYAAPGPTISVMAGPSPSVRGDRVLLGEVEVRRSQEPAPVKDLAITDRQRATFDGLQLLGAGVNDSDLQAGERLGVTLYWQARDAPLSDARFRLQLLDSSGSVRWETTIRPAGDLYPTSLWAQGDRFRGQFWLYLPNDPLEDRYSVVLLPEPPLRRTGVAAALRGWFGLRSGGLQLAELRLVERVHQLELPDMEHRLAVQVGNRAHLVGYDLDESLAYPGGSVGLVLYWQADGAMVRPYKVFTHLLGEDGATIAQHDAPPGGGCCPSNTWVEGEVIVDPHPIPLSADMLPGTYQLVVGMYDEEAGTRLPVYDVDGQQLGQDYVTMAPVAVLTSPWAPPAVTAVPSPHLESAFHVYLPAVFRGDRWP